MSMIASWSFLAVSLWGAWFTYNAYYPIHRMRQMHGLSFLCGWLTSELPLHHLAVQLTGTVIFALLGAFQHGPGVLGLVVSLLSWAGLAGMVGQARSAGPAVEQALRSELEGYRPLRFADEIEWSDIALPFPLQRPTVERIADIPFTEQSGITLKLDVYRGWGHPTDCPVLLQIHGGAWVIGSKNEQAVPLMRRMAERGWVCVSVDYRLSPKATFPDHLADVKRAIAWIRVNISTYGGDPNRIVATGGSAGGHLCALVGLTANDPQYQPGFEDVDTSVIGCVPFYGVYDFTDRFGHWPNRSLDEVLEQHVFKAPRADSADAYDAASPMSRIHADAPPFFIIHGDRDTLVPVEDARRFSAMLREVSRDPVVYAELEGAQHAFELFPSARTHLVVKGVERFLEWAVDHHAAASAGASRKSA